MEHLAPDRNIGAIAALPFGSRQGALLFGFRGRALAAAVRGDVPHIRSFRPRKSRRDRVVIAEIVG